MKPVASDFVQKNTEQKIYEFKLINEKGTTITITNYGAIISSFIIQQEGKPANDIVLGFHKPEAYLNKQYLQNYPYFGAAIGRYANRIKNARFKIDDKTFVLPVNKGNDHLHGGITGFDKKIWNPVSFNNKDNRLILELKSYDGDELYPGNLTVTLTFHLSNEDELSYEYIAVTDTPTIINLTHHSYFNLNNGKGNIRNHFLKINAEKILEQDDNFVANGRYIDVATTKYDFRNFYQIGNRLTDEEGYDQTFEIKKDSDELILAAEAYSEESDLKLQIFTNQPVIHLYTGNYITALNGKNGNKYTAFSGLCLETQAHPNAINIPHFPNTILRPGEQYYHKTIYRISQV